MVESTYKCIYFTRDGFFSNDRILENIAQFPKKEFFKQFNYNKNLAGDTSRYWLKAQELINNEKKIKFFKTHNFLGMLGNNQFTNSKNTIGAVYIVRDPRNVITSLKNHFEISYEDALKFMLNEKNLLMTILKKMTLAIFSL